MRCKHCSSSFRISTWILACGECKDQYCTKCMKRSSGIYYCEKCTVLIMRPPDTAELMKLKSGDLQEYLKRHNIPTLGLVEKRELVDLFCNRAIPVKNTKTNTVLNKIFSNFESAFLQNDDGNVRSSTNTSPTSERGPVRPPRAAKPQQKQQQQQQNRPIFSCSSSGNINSPRDENSTPHTLPRQSRPPPRPSAPPTQPTTSQIPVPPFPSSCEPSPSPKRYPKISDFSYIEELALISTKELKIILNLNRVDYKGCVEKTELLEKVQRLWLDNQKQKSTNLPENVEDLCKLCMDAPLDCVLLECGHIATCIDCGKKLAECPICRQYVSRVVRTFKA